MQLPTHHIKMYIIRLFVLLSISLSACLVYYGYAPHTYSDSEIANSSEPGMLLFIASEYAAYLLYPAALIVFTFPFRAHLR